MVLARYLRAYCFDYADMQKFPGLGAFHGSERKSFVRKLPQKSLHLFLAIMCHDLVPELFGTFNSTTATQSEVQLSSTFQAIVASFAKNPFVSPAPAWPKYNPNATTLANLAFNGNVALNDVVQTRSPAQFDGPCAGLWDKILLTPPTGAALV